MFRAESPAIDPNNNRNNKSYIYDAENKQTSYQESGVEKGSYYYDGDGRRVKRVANGVTTIYVYNVMGQLIAEYGGEPINSGTRYLTADHLGSTRVVTDAAGNVKERHDYLPFGEEIEARVSGRGDVGQEEYKVGDIRQKFTNYERDTESGLDFAQARMYRSQLGRFISPDPMYFQVTMALDPQFFNLYSHARNNPLRFTDPSGESVRIRGANTIGSIYEMAGGQEEFDRYFVVEGDRIWMRDGVDLSGASEGVRNLAGLVNVGEIYLFYNGNDFREIADLFDGATNERGELTREGRQLQRIFNGNYYNQPHLGYLVAVGGRRGQYAQPGKIDGAPIFAIIAINSDIPMIQEGLDTRTSDFANGGGIVALSGQLSGLGQRVSAASFFIHEGAEAQTFNRIGFINRFSGRDNYLNAHQEGMRVEERIRQALKLTGGFAGGDLKRGQ
ncbi:MAG TPA: RHS repeat-associated core domain-containing protein [Pyrinomonadaceae bacterium]|nr:RHS repeat-associated core domain-containing protein [Pyrinomonadaceae bacterium]